MPEVQTARFWPSATQTYLRFYAFQHPYVCDLIRQLVGGGVDGLLTLKNQGRGAVGLFEKTYSPNSYIVSGSFPAYDVDFEEGGAYAQYNWELFFHIPVFLASQLTAQGQYDKARKWLEFVFNPTTGDTSPPPERFWFFKPFRDEGKPDSIKKLLQDLAAGKAPGLATEIKDWQANPFEPHRIARHRHGAYQKTVVMKYLDNLIAWGDQLFAQDSIESTNEATQLYVLAAKLLGPRPEGVTGQPAPEPATYHQLRSKLDAFSNAAVRMENAGGPFVPPAAPANGGSPPAPPLLLYFCIPANEKLLGYWDTVEDRLFKIRHCMNIEGVVRQLPLFQPPINPALLVRARAMGVDLASVLDDLASPPPHYHFPFMLQKARAFCDALQQLGGKLLAALEKKDAEGLARLRAGHEKALLEATRAVNQERIKEAEDSLAGLAKAKESAEARAAHYRAVSARLPEESQYISKQAEALTWQIASRMAAFAGTSGAAVPGTSLHAQGLASGVGTKVVSGEKIAAIGNMVTMALGFQADQATTEGTTASYLAQLTRAQQDRDLQIQLAQIESQQVDKQTAAADIRRQIAEDDLANHDKQIDQAGQVEEFLKNKFSNQELYSWMVSQTASVCFQAYKLAYDLAKRAERAYQQDLGVTDSQFVQFGAWDSLHKGLLAGERLSLDLMRLESAYLEQNKRTYEITKHVSLAQLDPRALIQLKQTGACEVDVPEALFDLDYPSHYLRRIKSVSLTIPAVTGPYTSVSCTLTLLKNSVRRTPDTDPEPDFTTIQSIATSGGRNDAGLFDLSFQDERRLPFEGAGVIDSRWRLEFPAAFRQFDYDTISDVIVHISYTALEGGSKSRDEGLKRLKLALRQAQDGQWLFRAFRLREEFPGEWYRLQQGQTVEITIGRDRFPYFVSLLNPSIKTAMWLARTDGGTSPSLRLGSTLIKFHQDQDLGLWESDASGTPPSPQLDEPFKLTAAQPLSLEDLWLLVGYKVEVSGS